MLLVFRRREWPFVSADLGLCALDPNATCGVTEADTRRKQRVSGRELTEKGLRIVMETAPASRLVFYRVASTDERK